VKKTRTRKDKTVELVLMTIILIFSFLFWDTWFVYPVKLFAVLMHEVSHGIVTLITGGRVVSMNIGLNLGGSCVSEGGNSIFIASAGYLGSLLFGLLIFLSPNNTSIGKWVITFILAPIFLFAAFSAQGILFIASAAIIFSVLIFAGFFMTIPIVAIIIRSFGLLSCVYVLFDIKEDLLENNMELTDASHLSSLTGIPGIWFGIGWFLLSIILLLLAFRFTYKNR
jgi:Peptidase M50B-like